MIRKKSVQCTLVTLFLAGSLTGCSLFGASDPLLEPYAVAYNTNISAMQDMAGDRTDLFADDLVVVGDESGYQDETIKAEAAVIYNVTSNQVVFSHNAFERLHPASITKLMTVLVALKYGNLSDSVTVGDDIVKNSELKGTSLAKLKSGCTYTLEQLIYGALLPSGNDAALAIAQHVGGGSVEEFVNRMNAEAKELGATGTNFVNPHGLTDENHYSTAYDIYLIYNELLKYETFRNVVQTASYDFTYTDAAGAQVSGNFKTTVKYTNQEVTPPENVVALGGKTGTTSAAMYCLAMSSQDTNGNQYVSVILKADSREQLYYQMNQLLQKIYN